VQGFARNDHLHNNKTLPSLRGATAPWLHAEVPAYAGAASRKHASWQAGVAISISQVSEIACLEANLDKGVPIYKLSPIICQLILNQDL
jgi:hypothetical protein